MPVGDLAPTGNPDADALINQDPLALIIGMLLDQQIPIEWAFASPLRLQERLGADWSASAIAAYDPERFVEVFSVKPALHRYPSAMARRTQDLCRHIVEHHDGDAGRIWARSRSAARLGERIAALPGFGDEKSMIFMAVLAKRFGVQPAGWQDIAGPFADDQPRTVADIDGPEGLAAVRAWKKQQRRDGRTKQQ